MENQNSKLNILYVPINFLKPSERNPRKWNEEATAQLKESIRRFGLVDPFVVNAAPNRKNILIGGHFRLKVAKDMGIKSIPVVYVTISDLEREKDLNLRLNKAVGDWDWDLLKAFDEKFLNDVGFTSEELDLIFENEVPETFDLQKELEKLDINEIKTKKSQGF